MRSCMGVQEGASHSGPDLPDRRTRLVAPSGITALHRVVAGGSNGGDRPDHRPPACAVIMTNKSAKSRWSPDPGLVASALADAELVIGNAGGLPGGGRLGDQPESFEDRRREDSLFGAAPYEVGDST